MDRTIAVIGARDVYARSGKPWAERARWIEDTGFSTLQIVDHMNFQLGPIAGLMAAAAATTTLRIGTQVFCNDYRHPAMLAKECATLDLLSDGRLELGLGAGWSVGDYDATGIPFDDPPTRIDRFEEALQILKGCFGDDAVTFNGKHYTITGYNNFPKPVQKPSPPILIGGGARRMLRLAGREADIVSLNFDLRSDADRRPATVTLGGIITPEVAATGTASMVEQKLAWVREGAGDRFDDLELNIITFLTVETNDRESYADETARQLGIEPQQLLDLPFALIGSVDQMIDTLIERRERFGINYVTLPLPIITNAAQVVTPIIERLAGT
jgi:probable F420-dependent oxidoreductase